MISDLANIGTFVSNSTTKTVTAGTQTHLTDLCPLSLPAGSYAIVGTFLLQGAGRYYLETTGAYIPRVYSSAYDNKGYTACCLTSVYKASVATTPTLGLYVLPDGTGNRQVSISLWAVIIK